VQKPFLFDHLSKFLTAIGYTDGEEVRLRSFLPKTYDDTKPRNLIFTMPQYPVMTLTKWIDEGRKIYVVVHPGGDGDKDITACRTIFYEHDYIDESTLEKMKMLLPEVEFPIKPMEEKEKKQKWIFPKDAQKSFWLALGLPEPTVQVDTGSKSIHNYWTLSEPLEESQWRALQEDLIALSSADPVNKNPSRIMALAGMLNVTTGEHARIVGGTGKPHDYNDLRSLIPVSEVRKGISYGEFCKSFKFPINDSVPLIICLSIENQTKIKEGSDDYRNNGAFSLACDLIAASYFLESENQRYSGDPYDLFVEYCEKCSDGGGWGSSEWDTVWRSAEKKDRNTTLEPKNIINRIKTWVWENVPNKDVLNIGGIVRSFAENQVSVNLEDIPENATDEQKLILGIANYITLRDSGNTFKFIPYRRKLMDGEITGTRLSLDELEVLAKHLQRVKANDLLHTSEFLADVYDEIDRRAKEDNFHGLITGYHEIDNNTQGFQRTDLIAVAGRPGLGKTTFVLNIAKNICVRNNVPLAFFSLEMSRTQLAYKLLSNETQINFSSLRSGRLESDQWERLHEGIIKVSEMKFYIDDTPYITIAEVLAKSRKLNREVGGLGAIVIDYLQLMIQGDDPTREIGKITTQLKGLARELNVPIFILSQLNRGVESRTNKRPSNSDLRQSGRIEEDCDMIIMLYREDYYNSSTPDKGKTEVLITKHRNGPTGMFELMFTPETSLFENLPGSFVVKPKTKSESQKTEDDKIQEINF
jgi:replicative DNA helicase